CRLVYDRRAGASRLHYERGGACYRYLFRSTLKASAELMVEGEVLIPFIESLARRKPVYLPNHIDTDGLPRRHAMASPPPASPTVVFVGRIVPAKGIEVLLEAALLLRRRRLDQRLAIAGDGEPAYLAALRERFA